MAKRSLKLQTGNNPCGAKLICIFCETLNMRLVPVHFGKTDSGGKPHLVTGAAILAQRLERLRPLRIICSVRSAKTDHHKRQRTFSLAFDSQG